MKRSVLIASLLLAGNIAVADAQKWEKEPTSFYGIDFGTRSLTAHAKLKFYMCQLTAQPGATPKDRAVIREIACSASLSIDPSLTIEALFLFAMTPESQPRPFRDQWGIPSSRLTPQTFRPPLEDGLVTVSFPFAADRYEEMKDIFTQRYGPPSETRQVAVQNHMGAEYLNEELAWMGQRVSISLSRYGSTLNRGFAFLFVNEWNDKANAEREEMKRKAAEVF